MVDEFYEVPVDYFQDMKITRGSKYDSLSIVSPGFTEICYSNMRYAVRSLFQFWISKMPSLIRRLTTIVWLISLISKIVLRLYQDCYKTRRFGRQTADVCHKPSHNFKILQSTTSLTATMNISSLLLLSCLPVPTWYYLKSLTTSVVE
jgi:hypothetical protein